MKYYVNNEGPITSVNCCPQPGRCTREVDENDPELKALEEKLNSLTVKPVVTPTAK